MHNAGACRGFRWMTTELKAFIIKRQSAFHKLGPDSIQFKFYRNIINRERKLCKAKFYESKISTLKDNNPKRWWSEVKRLSGLQSRSGDLRDLIDAGNLDDLELANSINTSFFRAHARIPTG